MDSAAETPKVEDKQLQKHSCSTCARRKVKCDRRKPCTTCVKTRTECLYSVAQLLPRRRKRPAQGDLLARLHRYEDLLRKNNIDFTSPDSWVHFEPPINHRSATSSTSVSTERTRASNVHETSEKGETNWWAQLSDELRNPNHRQLPISPADDDVPQSSHESSIVDSPDTSAILFGANSQGSILAYSHPQPAAIFRFWQIFLDRVNPIIKIIHAPTMQQQILEAMGNLQQACKSVQALLFSIYNIAVISMTNLECEDMSGEDKSTLLTRYRTATQQALVEANLICSMDLRVLQALVLLLLSNPDSKSTFILTSVAVRIGQRLGLSGKSSSDLSVFENEMRIRLWWQILFLDTRASHGHPGVKVTAAASELADCRLPLNVNDADLYPEMSEPPPEYARATEMIYCLLKYEVSTVFRSSPHAAAFQGNPRKMATLSVPALTKDKLIDDLENLYEQKYLKYCDPKVPLHNLAVIMAKLSIHRMRITAHHPRQHPDRSTRISPQESDTLFFNSVRLIEYDNLLRKLKFSQILLRHMTAKTQLDALIYVLNDLRRRTTGELVETAWKQVEMVFDDHPRLIEDPDPLFVAIGDLTLKAWEVRVAAFASVGAGIAGQSEPSYILALLSRKNADRGEPCNRGTTAVIASKHPHFGPTQTTFENPGTTASLNTPIAEPTPMPLGIPSVDWTFWEDLLQDHGPDDFEQSFFGQNYGWPSQSG